MARSPGSFAPTISPWRFDMPAAVAVIVCLTALASIIGAVGSRHGVPLMLYGLLRGSEVFPSQPWRLITWVLFEKDPLSLVFACLALYWFGSDLCRTWGTRRFVAVYLGFTLTVALLTWTIGRFLWDEVYQVPHLGTWAITDALVIAWALLHPGRQIRLYFVLPVGGRALIGITIGITLLFALYYGVALFVPHFLAEGLMLIYLGAPRQAYLRWRMRRLQRIRRRYIAAVARADREEDESGQPPGKPPGKPPQWLN